MARPKKKSVGRPRKTAKKIEPAIDVNVINEQIQTITGQTSLNHMVITLDDLHGKMQFHLKMVKEHAGEITDADITYCQNLITRILINKFNL